MPRFVVEHEGKFAWFSSIADDYITPFLDIDSFKIYRAVKAFNDAMNDDIKQLDNMDYEEAEELRKMNADEEDEDV